MCNASCWRSLLCRSSSHLRCRICGSTTRAIIHSPFYEHKIPISHFCIPLYLSRSSWGTRSVLSVAQCTCAKCTAVPCAWSLLQRSVADQTCIIYASNSDVGLTWVGIIMCPSYSHLHTHIYSHHTHTSGCYLVLVKALFLWCLSSYCISLLLSCRLAFNWSTSSDNTLLLGVCVSIWGLKSNPCEFTLAL